MLEIRTKRLSESEVVSDCRGRNKIPSVYMEIPAEEIWAESDMEKQSTNQGFQLSLLDLAIVPLRKRKLRPRPAYFCTEKDIPWTSEVYNFKTLFLAVRTTEPSLGDVTNSRRSRRFQLEDYEPARTFCSRGSPAIVWRSPEHDEFDYVTWPLELYNQWLPFYDTWQDTLPLTSRTTEIAMPVRFTLRQNQTNGHCEDEIF